MNFTNGNPIKNDIGETIGAYIIGTETIHPNINGLYQGTSDYTVYMIFCLCQYGMWIHQTASNEQLQKYIEELLS